MKKTLPIHENTVIRTECWTHIKMAIIQTLPDYENWLYSHMNVYYDASRNEVFFGSSFNPEQTEYYTDILDIEELDFHKIGTMQIIDFAKKQIDRNCYFVVLIKDTNALLHEVLLFGYDDELKVFNSIFLNKSGGFNTNNLAYADLQEGYAKALAVFKNNPSSYYYNRSFCFLMSRMTPKNRYQIRNYAPEYFAKMCNETYGTRVIFQCSDRDETYLASQTYYTGISCLLILKDLICNITVNTSDLELMRIRRSFFKLYEHRCIVLNAMKWYENQWKITNDELIELRKKYSLCCEEMYTLCMLVLKLELTLGRPLIDKVINRISEQYYSEKKILDRYVIIIREWYFKEVLSKSLDASV